MKDMNQQPDDDMHRVRSPTKELLSVSSLGGTWKFSGSPSMEVLQKQSKKLSFWVFWRLHYIVIFA